MKLLKRLLWMIPMTIKWIFIFALWIVGIAFFVLLMSVLSALILALTPAIIAWGLVIVFVVGTIGFLAWEDAGDHV